MEIQKPYAKHCPDDRVNFLNYYYVLYKLCELLNENTFLPFSNVKETYKTYRTIPFGKKFVRLHWEFVPTI